MMLTEKLPRPPLPAQQSEEQIKPLFDFAD